MPPFIKSPIKVDYTNSVNDFQSHAFAINACLVYEVGRNSEVSRLLSLESESLTLLAIRDYVATVQSHKSVV